MLERTLLLFLLVLGASCGLSARQSPASDEVSPAPPMEGLPEARWILNPRFGELFEEAGVKGVFVTNDPESGCYRTNDTQRATQGFLPASTYKLLNSLIALETGVFPGAPP